MESFYSGINYPVSKINQNFRIKVSGKTTEIKIHSLVGVSGLIELLNDTNLVNNLLDRAFNSMNDKIECKLRRGIKIIFYSK